MDEDGGDSSKLLHQAASYGNVELLADLLAGSLRCKINSTDRRGYTPIHVAAAVGSSPCTSLLLEAGAENQAFTLNEYDARTPLHLAAVSGSLDTVRLLVESGADLYATDRYGYTALELSQRGGFDDIFNYLCTYIQERALRLKNARQDLEKFCEGGDLDGIEKVLKSLDRDLLEVVNAMPDEQYTLLYRACENGQTAVAQLLLRFGADCRIHPATQCSPLYAAVSKGHKDIVELLLKEFPNLIQAGNSQQWLPIHVASANGNVPMLKLLLTFKYPGYMLQSFVDPSGQWEYLLPCDVNALDRDARTPLYLAVMNGHLRSVRYLLDYEIAAHPSAQSPRSRGTSATSSPLRESPSQPTSSDTTKTSTKVKYFRPVCMDLISACGRTVLHEAVISKHSDIAKLLVEHRADVNLSIALTDDELSRLETEEHPVIGSTALAEACRNGDLDLANFLIEKGATDLDHKALAVCLQIGCESLICRMLVKNVFADPEFRVNKKAVDMDISQQQQSGHKGRATVTPSALYPGTAIMLNWHNLGLTRVQENWVTAACLHLNAKLKPNIQLTVVTSAITRIDISKNELKELPDCLFRMVSLRILNAAHNRIESLPSTSKGETATGQKGGNTPWMAPCLEEIHLQNNRLSCIPVAIFDLPNLVTLDVSNNKLTNLPPKMWAAARLKDLNASFNMLESLPLLRDIFKPRSIGGGAASETAASIDWEIGPVSVKDGTESSNAKTPVSPSLSAHSNDVGTGIFDGGSEKSGSADDSTADARSFKQDDSVSYVELKHHNLWQKSIELNQTFTDDDIIIPPVAAGNGTQSSESATVKKSSLTSLNLAHNQFEVIPEGLACLAPNLGRLTLAYNQISDIGCVNQYPARLKHLDLANNRIRTWFHEPRMSSLSDLCCLGRASEDQRGPAANPRQPPSPILGRRSHSVHRAGVRSLSVARVAEITAVNASCVHRRHNRLENLRTLILAGNELVSIEIHVLESVPASQRSSVTSLQNRRSSRNSTSSEVHHMSLQSPKHRKKSEAADNKPKLVFPNLTMLDLSTNRIISVPAVISTLSSLSVLNLAQNPGITSLPPDMGLLSKLWNLNVNGCTLGEPLKTMLESHKYKTIDVIGYLKSVLEDSKAYSRLKLMIVGVQGIGKTSLLEQLRLEGTGTYKKAPPEGWAKRMGNKDINRKTAKGINISTVGVDVGDWTFEPKKVKGQPNFGPVTFRTWDFGGQREYYATHQYFLSKRSLYLVVWKITDGEAGVAEIMQWLVNIQARAPNSPVVIVGTHFDEVLSNNKKFPTSFVEDLQRMIKERFISVPDADKRGLPKVVDSVMVSSKTKYNIRTLCSLIYSTAFELRSPGTKERLLEQKIPASYLALEDVVCGLAKQRLDQGKDPVLTSDQYRSLVQDQLFHRFGSKFRDISELNQATAFLHENGVLLHYEDATLKDLYFLDPQWLCDVLAHVITIREINPFAKNGLMKTDDLKMLFKSSRFNPTNIRGYILNLLQKFEVALTWDSKMLLIPCLLPDQYQLKGGYPDCEVKLPVKGKGWVPKPSAFMSHSVSMGNMQMTPPVQSPPASPSSHLPHRKTDSPRRSIEDTISPLVAPKTGSREASLHRSLSGGVSISGSGGHIPVFALNRPKTSTEQLALEFYQNCTKKDEACIRRLYMMSYFPSGFWSRLITRMLGEENIPGIMQQYFRVKETEQGVDYGEEGVEVSDLRDRKLNRIVDGKAEWILWQTGIEIQFLGQTLFVLQEFLPLAEIRDLNYKDVKYKYQLDNNWVTLGADNMAIMELYIPQVSMTLRYQGADSKLKLATLETDRRMMTRLLAITVELIDTLLEDWYPSLGTRFVHTSEGKFLVTRLVPCPYCLLLYHKVPDYELNGEHNWTVLSIQPSSGNSASSQAFSTGNDTVVFHKSFSTAAAISEDENRSKEPTSVIDAAAVQSPPDKTIRKLSNSSQDSGVAQDASLSDSGCVKSGTDFPFARRDSSSTVTSPAAPVDTKPSDNAVYSFTIEECILAAHYATLPRCPSHGPLLSNNIAPDTVFLDLGNSYLIQPEQVKRGKMLGRGAFGFVFKASVKFRGSSHFVDVAMKMFQPVDPGFGARPSANNVYKAAFSKWQRDPSQYACRAHCTARQELNVLATLRHPNIVSLIGVCPRPLALVVNLAPLGSLNHLLQNYRRSGARLSCKVIQEVLLQIARAIEYLHQQHIIYRDLKSENVLVFQFPPPFSHLTGVDVKLGDYGISRSILPTGGAKGFGGTEGFMAPEIMRYNGEEEYTEKVDCFSFGMFVYELLTLKLPFDGHEQVKEYILEGGRPTLTAKEMLYPSNNLDLMIVAWSQFPQDRPSASQLVSICSAPEFAHLLDVVSINDSDSAVITADAFARYQLGKHLLFVFVLPRNSARIFFKRFLSSISCQCVVLYRDFLHIWMYNQQSYFEESFGSDTDISSTTYEGEVWISRADGQVSVLSCGQYGWLDYKSITVNEESFVTAVCLVEETVWLGELTGLIRVYCAKTYVELYNFTLAPHILPICEPNVERLSVPVVHIVYLHSIKRVVVASGCPGALILCKPPSELGDVAANGASSVVFATRSAKTNIHCIACLPVKVEKGQDKMFEIWSGGPSASLTVFELKKDQINLVTTLNHFSADQQSQVTAGSDVHKMTCSHHSPRYIWTYIYPGCNVYQWNTFERTVVSKLDCSKLVPCSESINTISIEEKLSPARCQITSLCLLERDDGAQLYIGTTWGVVIVAEADQLRPITAFRPHLEDVRIIIPLGSHRKTVVLSSGHQLPSTGSGSQRSTGGGSYKTTSGGSGSTSRKRHDSSDTITDAVTGLEACGGSSSYGGGQGGPSGSTILGCQPNYIVTVGKGYRNLIQRFVDLYKEEQPVLDSRSRDCFAMVWRTEDWIVS